MFGFGFMFKLEEGSIAGHLGERAPRLGMEDGDMMEEDGEGESGGGGGGRDNDKRTRERLGNVRCSPDHSSYFLTFTLCPPLPRRWCRY